MEEYRVSIRTNALTVSELIDLLHQFDGNSTISLSAEMEGQIDIYQDENGDLILR